MESFIEDVRTYESDRSRARERDRARWREKGGTDISFSKTNYRRINSLSLFHFPSCLSRLFIYLFVYFLNSVSFLGRSCSSAQLAEWLLQTSQDTGSNPL